MQLIWIGGPAHRMVSFSLTAKRLFVGALVVFGSLVLLGAFLQWMGLRVAVDHSPDVVRSMGGVVSQTQMQALQAHHARQVAYLQQRLDGLQGELQSLQASKTRWLKELGWKSETPLTGDNKPFWFGEGGQGGPLKTMPLPSWATKPDPLQLTEHNLENTKERLLWMNKSWENEQKMLALLPLSSPLVGDHAVISRFGSRADPMTHSQALHEGLDLIAPRQSRVIATAPGRVMRSQYAGAYGELVEIAHGHHYITRYAHLDKRLVAEGDVVQRGQSLGLLGSTGRSTGPHLHYEVLFKGQAVNPEKPLQALWTDKYQSGFFILNPAVGHGRGADEADLWPGASAPRTACPGGASNNARGLERQTCGRAALDP